MWITLDVVALEKHRKARGSRNQKEKVEGRKVLKQVRKEVNSLSLQVQDCQNGMYLSHR
ncbi:hypothetical protein CY34DRAFT_808810 [Suillus luteus UH-Slu-Lm8-n1]|uniref:Uncharacterized protein n=1 Tax=Suillus luteus UH-Slu-Lm8-n1 TaxID=930992 RepID=A0A0C9ZN40_9AGAM|nr:hypothetical protein CY34DRAFT_808810 [Suillus luteus UH-Slu-Lm8-n1]